MTHHSKVMRLSGALAVASAMCIVATGCTHTGDSTAVPRVAKDVDAWVLPLDPYLLSYKDLKKQNYATALINEQCLIENGVRRPVPYVDFDAAYGDDEIVRSQLTPKSAAEFGYHSTKDIIPQGIDAWETYRSAPWSSSEDEIFEACFEKIADKGPQFSNRVMNFTSTFAASAYKGALVDPAVIDHAGQWKQCMTAEGIADLPADPSGMPTESQLAEFISPSTGGGLDGDSSATSVVTVEEIKSAVADATCRVSSGYQDALYAALWDREASALAENEVAFQDVGTQIDETRKRIDEVIAKYASLE